jgi:hypothetical protein
VKRAVRRPAEGHGKANERKRPRDMLTQAANRSQIALIPCLPVALFANNFQKPIILSVRRGFGGRRGVHLIIMKPARLYGVILAAFGLLAGAVLSVHAPAPGADAYDSATTTARAGADISDAYLFPSPANSGNVVAVMNVSPGIAAGQGLNAFFDQHVLYQMKFDNLVASEAPGVAPTENMVIQFSVGASGSGTQQIFVYGPSAPNQTGANNTLLPQSGSGFINKAFETTNGLVVFAGAREDPFFFDTTQFYKMFPDRNGGSTAQGCLPASFGGSNGCPQGFNAPGTDVQANTNVLSIVIEMPRTLLMPNGVGKIAYWATTATTNGE